MQEVCPPFRLMIFERHANLKYKYGSRSFWCRGYYMTGAKRRGDVGIAPYGMTENGADRVVRPYKRAVKGRR